LPLPVRAYACGVEVTGETGNIIGWFVTGQTFVTIAATDRGFKTRGCGTWTKTG